MHVVHSLRYDLLEAAALLHAEVRLRPRDDLDQRVDESTLAVLPAPRSRRSERDAHGNAVERFEGDAPIASLRVIAESTVTIDVASRRARTASWEQAAPAWELAAPLAGEIAALAREWSKHARSEPALVAAVIEGVRSTLRYDPSAAASPLSLDELLSQRRGVCQDFSHLALAALRALGIPCRYVSGYVAGETALHAWVAIDSRHGTIFADPTHGSLGCEEHVVCAVGTDYQDCAPATLELAASVRSRCLSTVEVG